MVQSPFPGMDPYLESSEMWQDVHGNLMNVFREQLIPRLLPNYVVKIETEIIIDRSFEDVDDIQQKKVVPDVSVMQVDSPTEHGGTAVAIPPAPLRVRVPIGIPMRIRSIHIHHHDTKQLVTVIELLSPVNKRPGKGRDHYLDKRDTYLESNVHLIEIDLLRKYPCMPLIGSIPEVPYLAIISNFYERPAVDVWPIRLQDALPTLSVPLLHPDPPVPLDMQQAFHTAYQRARYDALIDYTCLPEPPLSDEERTWITSLLKITP